MRIIVRQRRHFGPHVAKDFNENAAKTKADRGPQKRVVDHARISFGDAADHRLNQHVGHLKSRVARVVNNRTIGLRNCRGVRAAKAHATDIALMQKAGRLGLDGDRHAIAVLERDGFVL